MAFIFSQIVNFAWFLMGFIPGLMVLSLGRMAASPMESLVAKGLAASCFLLNIGFSVQRLRRSAKTHQSPVGVAITFVVLLGLVITPYFVLWLNIRGVHK